jgi:hypothetical protein
MDIVRNGAYGKSVLNGSQRFQKSLQDLEKSSNLATSFLRIAQALLSDIVTAKG